MWMILMHVVDTSTLSKLSQFTKRPDTWENKSRIPYFFKIRTIKTLVRKPDGIQYKKVKQKVNSKAKR